MSDVISVPCNFCNSTEFKEYDREGSWIIVKCSSCGFIYTNPQPTPESLPNYYSEDYFKDKRHKSKFYNEDGTVKEQSEQYTNRIIDIENKINDRGYLVEIGSERGSFLTIMNARGWDIQGVEISEDASKKAISRGIPTFNGIYEDFNLPSKADVICMYQTLEHVPKPKELITKVFDDLKVGGIFIAEVPNVQCFEMKYSKNRRHLSYDLPRHLNHFSPNQLKKELLVVGFKEVDIELYPSKILINILGVTSRLKSKKSRSKKNEDSSEVQTGESNEIPIIKKEYSKKTNIINFITRYIPGWRFTIIAKK